MTRSKQAGFTLIEALVALSILSTAATLLLSATQSHIARIGAINDRTTARWVAENRLVELGLGLGDLPETVEMLGVRWRVVSDLTETADPDLIRADIRVMPAGQESSQGGLAVLSGFIDIAGRNGT